MGIDPSIAATGFAVIRDGHLVRAGRISTSPSQPEPARLAEIRYHLLQVMRQEGVTEVAVEDFRAFYRWRRFPHSSELLTLFGHPTRRKNQRYSGEVNPRDIFIMKAAQTTAQLTALEHGAKLFLYSLREWKGDHRRSKEATLTDIRLLYGLEISDDNIADAIMIAHHHLTFGHLTPDKGVDPQALPGYGYVDEPAAPRTSAKKVKP